MPEDCLYMNYIEPIRYIWHQIDKLNGALLLFYGSRNIVSLITKSVFIQLLWNCNNWIWIKIVNTRMCLCLSHWYGCNTLNFISNGAELIELAWYTWWAEPSSWILNSTHNSSAVYWYHNIWWQCTALGAVLSEECLGWSFKHINTIFLHYGEQHKF